MKRNAGFTLIELLVAMAFLAGVGAALAAVFQTGIRTYQKIRMESRAQQTARALFIDIEREMRNAVDVPGRSFRGGPGEISFCTLARDIPSADAEEGALRIAAVRYHWTPDERGGGVLSRERNFLGDDVAEEPAPAGPSLLIDDASVLRFQYARRPAAESAPPEWSDVWKEPRSFPAAVQISLHWGAPDDPASKTFTKIVRLPTGVLP